MLFFVTLPVVSLCEGVQTYPLVQRMMVLHFLAWIFAMKLLLSLFTCLLISAVMLISCNSNNASTQRHIKHYSQAGSVTSIEIIEMKSRNSGGGAVLGAVLGGVIGHQMGGGRGRDVATGVGVIGGALAGNQIEKRNKNDSEIYRVTVMLDNGRTQQFDYQDIENLRVGDRVNIENGQISQM